MTRSGRGITLPTCIELGTGDVAVFLLHGVGGRATAWDQTLPVLAGQGFRCIAWDAPGYGESPWVEPYTTRSLANALLELINSVGATRNVILGHSMGGLIAQEAVAMRATGIHGLILFSTSPAFGKPGGDWQQQFLTSRFAPLDAGLGLAGMAPALVKSMVAPAQIGDGLGDMQGNVQGNVQGDAQRYTHAVMAAVKLMSSVPEATYRAALSAIVSFNRLDNLANIAVPTLCLAGEFDTNAPPAVMEKMASRIPNARYQCLAGVGHLGNLEAPDQFNAAVLAFLKTHFAA